MQSSIRLGRLFGIEIRIHYSWIIIAILVVLSLVGHFNITNPNWAQTTVWFVAVGTALLFFASILIHEFSHSAVARRENIPVHSITLFALGGVAATEQEPRSAKAEFWMAIVGPLTSLALGVLFLGLAVASGWRPELGTPSSPVWAASVWLGYINIGLAIFNMLPGFPLDGGRVLRAIVWWISGSLVRATRISAAVSQVVAAGLIVLGLFSFFRGAGFSGLWLAFIGWFLSQSASASYEGVETSHALAGRNVGSVMDTDCPRIDRNATLLVFAEDFLLRTGRRCFVVQENGHDVGLVTVHELKQAPRNQWPFRTVGDIARPFTSVRTVSPETDLKEALDVMMQSDVSQLPVMSDGQLLGMVSRRNVLELLKTHADLKAA
jgi:Zn-dependent protease/predicted transcriptional regulator